MKATILICILGTTLYAGQPMTDTITPEALARLQSPDPIAGSESVSEADTQTERPKEPCILSESTILRFAGRWTLLPKGAVIHLPERLRERVAAQPDGEFLPWLDFLAANAGWLSTAELSFEQAAGQVTIDEDKLGFWKKQDKLIVAVHLRGPISVNLTAYDQ